MRLAFEPRAAQRLRAMGVEALDALFPPVCALCPAPDGGDGLGCVEHRLPLAPGGARCGRCASALPFAIADGERCAQCRTRAPGFERVVVLADYRAQPAIREWILAFKHGRRQDLAQTLGRALALRLASARAARALDARAAQPSGAHAAQPSGAHAVQPSRGHAAQPSDVRAAQQNDVPVLVPVPLHFVRRLERGYDQAALLARSLASVEGLRIVRALRRVRATGVQGAPGSSSRTANVHDAFRAGWRAAQRVAGRDVWLVDDVLTSGATAAECARVLRGLGARAVSVVALARA